ncbi:MAG: hypothetical protein FWD52_04710 [Candidatus Bathyarchaeota archaeon]|nr:hypothetical protein [Candidatus Termiticorpusculum sp.]
MEYEQTPDWVYSLQKEIAFFLSGDYLRATHWQYDGEGITLDFPAVEFADVDLEKTGLLKATQILNGEARKNPQTLQTEFFFPKPNPQPPMVVHVVPPIPQSNTLVTNNNNINRGENTVSNNSNNNSVSGNNSTNSNSSSSSSMTMEEYVKPNSVYVSPKTCAIGDFFRIVGPYYFEAVTYEGKTKEVCFINVIKEANNTSMKVKLNKENAANLASTFTDNKANWDGKRIRIINKKTYQQGEGFVYAPA